VTVLRSGLVGGDADVAISWTVPSVCAGVRGSIV
jgi:hypothetical protein